jgi:hypothetical protein
MFTVSQNVDTDMQSTVYLLKTVCLTGEEKLVFDPSFHPGMSIYYSGLKHARWVADIPGAKWFSTAAEALTYAISDKYADFRIGLLIDPNRWTIVEMTVETHEFSPDQETLVKAVRQNGLAKLSYIEKSALGLLEMSS